MQKANDTFNNWDQDELRKKWKEKRKEECRAQKARQKTVENRAKPGRVSKRILTAVMDLMADGRERTAGDIATRFNLTERAASILLGNFTRDKMLVATNSHDSSLRIYKIKAAK